jgi:hypothetical protein
MTEPTAQSSPQSELAVAAYVDAAAAALGLELAPEHRPGVITNLTFMLEESAALMAIELDWEEEQAMVFVP